jgi:CheY-like chemotaxis protein
MGSEFSVWLPLAAPVEATAPPPRPSPPAQITTTTTTTGTRRRVLLVDDNKDVASSMSRWLRLIGHDVRVALDGIEAIRIAEQFRPEVALLDLAMPNVSGYDVARTLRSASWGKNMTIVAVTGWGREDDQRRSADAGFDRHMTKPVDPLALEIFLESANRSAPTPSDVLRILH